MRRKRQVRTNHDRWLVSYADFITLLFALFVVLFATGQSDNRKKVELAASIQSAFAQMGLFTPHSKLAERSIIAGPGDSRFNANASASSESMRAVELRIRQSLISHSLAIVGIAPGDVVASNRK